MAAIKVCDHLGNCAAPNPPYFQWMAEGIDEARERRDSILNLSFSGDVSSMLVFESLYNAVVTGALCVATSGNEGHGFKTYPGAYRYVTLNVGACWMNGLRWKDNIIPGASTNNGSNYGNWLDVVAPGGQTIVTTKIPGLLVLMLIGWRVLILTLLHFQQRFMEHRQQPRSFLGWLPLSSRATRDWTAMISVTSL